MGLASLSSWTNLATDSCVIEKVRPPDMIHLNNPKNFKILYVINSENCFYRKLALTRAKHSHKAVSRRKTSDFNRWHSKWVKEHVSDIQETNINEWFMGKSDGLVNNKTHKITKSDQDRTPYRTYYKFKAEIIKE